MTLTGVVKRWEMPATTAPNFDHCRSSMPKVRRSRGVVMKQSLHLPSNLISPNNNGNAERDCELKRDLVGCVSTCLPPADPSTLTLRLPKVLIACLVHRGGRGTTGVAPPLMVTSEFSRSLRRRAPDIALLTKNVQRAMQRSVHDAAKVVVAAGRRPLRASKWLGDLSYARCRDDC
jgi:hypothetical protein